MKSKLYLVLSFLCLTLFSCDKNTQCKEKENIDCACFMIYNPVCGCDEKTYSNACVAYCVGVEVVSQGECP
jgi:hypothetical protein